MKKVKSTKSTTTKKLKKKSNIITNNVDSSIFIETLAEEEAVSLPSSNSNKKKKFVFERLSASMLKTWLLCKRKFHHQYIDGIKSAPNTSFTLGTSAHFALEQANRSLADSPRQLNPLEIEHYVQIFRDTAAKLFVTDLSLFETGQELVSKELNSLDPEEKIIGIEKEFDLLTPEGVRIYGFIDKISEVDSNTIKITDYKTSVIPLSYEEARVDEQLSMYDLAARLMYPEYENRILELKYLRSGDSVISYRSQIESETFRKLLVSIYSAIKQYVKQATDHPTGELNHFCNWCSYKNNCPQYIEIANTLLPSAPTTLELTDSSFIKMYEKVCAIYKAAEEWKDILKVWALTRIEADPETQISDGERAVTIYSSTRTEYPLDEVVKLVGHKALVGKETGNPLVKIVNKELENYCRKSDDPTLRNKLDKVAIVKFTSPSLKLKKNK